MEYYRLAVGFQVRALFMAVPWNFRIESCVLGTKWNTIAWPWVFRVESCSWLCRGISGSNPACEAPNGILSLGRGF